MAFDFPSNPNVGNTYSIAGITYVWDGIAWNVSVVPAVQQTAQIRNRIVNGAMQISQENGDVGGVATGYYPADQWMSQISGITSFQTARQVAQPYQIYMMGVKATLAAGDYAFFNQILEGTQLADFLWGTVNAKPAVLRFEAYSQFGGTFCISIRNTAVDRSFLAPFTVAAQTWTTVVIPIPGDVLGTWPVTVAAGLSVNIVYATGSTYHGVPGWQAGNKLGLPTTSNGYATQGSNYIRNVGLYLDPDGTGVPPPFEILDVGQELRRCQRYWWRWDFSSASFHFNFLAGSASALAWRFETPVQMRQGPTASSSLAGATMQNCSNPVWDLASVIGGRFYVTVAAAGAGNVVPAAGNHLTLNARM